MFVNFDIINLLIIFLNNMKNFEVIDKDEMEEYDFKRIKEGQDIEEGVLGSERKRYEINKLEDYVPFDEAIELVKRNKFQPNEKPFPKDLRLQIANDLRVYLRQLDYYTSIFSPLY